MRIILLVGFLFLTFHQSVASQEIKLEKDVSCYVVLKTQPFLTGESGKLNQPKFQLFDVCHNRSAEEQKNSSKIEIERDGRKEKVTFSVLKEFVNGKEAKEFADKFGIINTPFEKIADCQIIRRIDIPLTKKPGVPKRKVIALLNTCLDENVPQQRPTIQVVRNGKKQFRLFEVLKTFDSQAEAEKYAKEDYIIDVDF